MPLHVHVRPRALRNAWLNFGGTPRDPWGRAAVAAYGVERDRNVLHYAGWPPRFFELFGEIRRTRPLVRQLAVPCRAYFSERDELVSVRSAREFVDVPQAVVTMLPHSGHAYYDAQEGRNRHHYEYWTDIDPKTKVYRAVPMPRKFFVEMVMDRIAACKIYHCSAYTDADALNYLVHAEEVRDGSMMHPDTRRELLYVLTMLRDRGEKETFRFLREVVLAGKPFAVPVQ